MVKTENVFPRKEVIAPHACAHRTSLDLNWVHVDRELLIEDKSRFEFRWSDTNEEKQKKKLCEAGEEGEERMRSVCLIGRRYFMDEL